MDTDAETNRRLEQLNRELTLLVRLSFFYGWLLHVMALSAVGIAVICSFVGSVAGISQLLPSQVVGALVLVPSAVALMATRFKLQEKSNWHFQRGYNTQRLRSQLQLQLSIPPTATEIAAIAKARDELIDTMQKEWVDKHAFAWTSFKPQYAFQSPSPPRQQRE